MSSRLDPPRTPTESETETEASKVPHAAYV